MSSIPNTQLWNEFFSRLRDLPELWKIKSDIYKDGNRKRQAWQELLKIYKKIDLDANLDTLKKRLANIKTCYRRELKKVEASLRSGAGAEEEYKPNLWYFENLDFLHHHEVQIPGISTLDNEDEDDEPVEFETDLPETNSTPRPPKKRKTVVQNMAERNELLKEALGKLSQHVNSEKDEASVYAESWATSFRKLSFTQKIYAKKAIEEILVLGQLNVLSMNSVKSTVADD